MLRKPIGSKFLNTLLSVSLTLVVLCGGVVAAPQDNDIFVKVPVAPIKHMPKTSRRPRRPNRPARKAVERQPLLAAQLRLYKVRADGSNADANIAATFYSGDRLRLGVIANQPGYLTIIRQPAADKDGEILFPTSLLNEGGNYVAKNKEYIVPSNCPPGIKPGDCAYIMPETSGRELFTIIFSRDPLAGIPETAVTPTGAIGAAALKAIEDEAVKQLGRKYGTANSRYAVFIINENRQDNEEIFARFPLVNRGPSPIRGSVQHPAFVKVKTAGGASIKSTTSRRPLKVAKL